MRRHDGHLRAQGPGERAPTGGADRFVDGFDYPMFVVTAADPGTGERAGCLVGFTTQTSIDPFRYLVCLSTRNRTFRIAAAAPVLAVHAPARDQTDLAELFGGETGDEIDKFARCAWQPGPHGVPLLTDCPRRLVGEIRARVDLGDHHGFLLAPVEVWTGAGTAPLTFTGLPDIAPGHPA
ncbi:oxidoreductase [Actinomadura craniellae]|uniref:Oxidoreductase n=1 Tax=Actinomadura craniellae TaxID=2231787 RepID=A0A365HAS9_9ACTN|nr:flavin reductase family protein [Actinomadura craniellae]RAY16122.1 oxidoreductase [Actinomadura craniellae]